MAQRRYNIRQTHGLLVHRADESPLEMLRSSNLNSTMFELQTFSTDSKFEECFKHFVVECEFVEKSLSTNMFFSQIQPITQTTVISSNLAFMSTHR